MRLGGMMILVISVWQAGASLLQARDAYLRSATSKKDALNFEQLLDSVKEDATPVLVCYKGAAEMLKAKNTGNPISKLSCFKRGKNLIEQSIARDTASVECRFIRYTIQGNLPGFLDYNKNMRQDSLLIVKGLDTTSDMDLKNKITAYFNHLKTRIKND